MKMDQVNCLLNDTNAGLQKQEYLSWQSVGVNRYLDYSSTAVISLTAARVQTVVL